MNINYKLYKSNIFTVTTEIVCHIKWLFNTKAKIAFSFLKTLL